MHDIGSWTHKCQKYIHLSLYLSDQLNERSAVVHIMYNVHLVDNFQINLLIDMNIIDSEHISTDISSWKIIIEECHNMLVNLIIMSQKNSYVQQIIWVSSKTVISSQSIQQVMIKTEKQSLFNDKDLIFHSFYSETFAYVVDANMSFIHIQNDRFINIIVSCHICLDNISKYEEEDCYAVSIKNVNLIIYKSLTESIIQMSETQLANKITIYGDKLNKVTTLTAVVKTYPDL